MAPAIEDTSSEPQEADTWVKVHRRKGRRPAKEASVEKVSPSQLTASDPTISLKQVKQDHDHFASEWTSSPAHGRLQELLSGHTSSTSVTKAICFGLGTFDPPAGEWFRKRTSHIQLAAFLVIVEHLQREANSYIRCVFQEPLFNAVDKAFIASLGHEVVESPVGFQLVDSETLAFGVHLYRDICTQIMATHIPVMYIGTSYNVWEDNPGSDLFRVEDLNRLKELYQLSVSVKFPENQAETVFNSTTIHWRQKDQS
ncbi:hypothetical protein F4859DRAFT_267677 [Xylaria cf. heliscus]|nr:hypothetical protein F4859DRAFT_267677 [Xylaria cf. heliscus]